MQSAKLGTYTVYFENSEEYHHLKREVWGANTYYIELDLDEPTIIDVGAYIGLTTLYYKKIYPGSHIVAIEPFYESAEILRKNIYENQLENIDVLEKAIAGKEGEQKFYFDSSPEKWLSTAGFHEGAWTGDQTSSSTTVETISLQSLLETYKPDLVKLDIEGAEEKVLLAAKDVVTTCANYLIEFHPIEGRGMEHIIKLFEDNGFTVTVTKDGSIMQWQKIRGLCIIEARR
jgi:FkbM family methyltransferase